MQTNKEKIFLEKVKASLEVRIRKEVEELKNFNPSVYVSEAQTMREKKEATDKAVEDLLKNKNYTTK